MIKGNIIIESEINIQLRANDFDWSKYINNSNYLQFFEQGRWDWESSNNLDLVDSKLVGVVSKMSIAYINPIYWSPLKEVIVKTELKKYTQFSITLQQTIRDNETIFCTADVQLVLFDTENKKPMKTNQLFR